MQNDNECVETMVSDYVGSIAILRKIAYKSIKDLSEFQDKEPLNPEEQKSWNHIFGLKETVMSVTAKYTGIISKLMPMEFKMVKATNKDTGEIKVQEISKNDLEIIKRYLQKVKDAGLEDELGLGKGGGKLRPATL